MGNQAYIEKQINRTGKEVAKLSHRNPWPQDMTYIMQLPGFGAITDATALHRTQCGASVTVLAGIGELQRFESANHLACYSGLTGGWTKVAPSWS
jgi:hypothetical protein